MARLSVVIPVYNAGGTLPRTLASLRRMSPAGPTEAEVLAVNDGSSDDSLGLLRREASRPAPFLLHVFDQPNRGAAGARNTALAAATGEWVFFLDADDELAFDPLPLLRAASDETAFAFTLEYRKAGRLLCRVRPVRLTPRNWADVLTATNPFQPSSLLIRRSCLREPFREGIACVEDWLCWLTNPTIWQSLRVVTGVTSARIHLHGQNITAQYERAGLNRVLAAEQAGRFHGGRLTALQRNNLYLQQQIGRMQQRLVVGADAFLRLPCDPVLYAKLWVYKLCSLVGVKATSYG